MQPPSPPQGRPGQVTPEEQELIRSMRAEVHHALVEALGAPGVPAQAKSERRHVLDRARETVTRVVSHGKGLLLPQRVRDALALEVVDEVLGFGPLQQLLDDPTISEIMVNGPRDVVVERDGLFETADVAFDDGEHVRRICQRVLAPIGRRLDEQSPMVDARLPDGSRLNAVIPPVAVGGPFVTIRKHTEDTLTFDDLVEFGAVSRPMWQFLDAAVRARLNIVVSGGPGSGKTTLLRALARAIPEGQRVIVMEDAAELMIERPNFVSTEARPPSTEGMGEVTIGDLVRNSLRMRPDRIIVGEVRGKEALDMLQALNTGTEGSLSTLHANTPEDAIVRIESMCMMAGLDLSTRAIARQIASAVHLIVQLNRFSDGTRKTTRISELVPQAADLPLCKDVFAFRQTGIDERGGVVGAHEFVAESPEAVQCAIRLERVGSSLQDILREPSPTE